MPMRHSVPARACCSIRRCSSCTSSRIETVGVTAAGQFIAARQVFSSVPLTLLPRIAAPAAPPDIIAAASALQYRGMILIYLVIEAERFTEFDAHYFPGADVRITRLSEPKNYGLAVSPTSDGALCRVAVQHRRSGMADVRRTNSAQVVRDALARAGLPLKSPVTRVATRRLPQAYPIYTEGYRRAFDIVDRWAGSMDGLLTFGRQGLFAHDNTHHALAMAYAANRCLSDDGALDRQGWAASRRQFESHVVED